MATSLAQAQEDRRRRGEAVLGRHIDEVLDRVGLSEERCVYLSAADVGPHARKKLSGLLKFYAKKARPFTECKRDQIANGLSEEHADRRCAVLVDLIKGSTIWHGGGKKASATALSSAHQISSSEHCAVIDDDVAALLDGVDSSKLALLLAEGQS